MQLVNLYMIKLGERNVFGMWDLQDAEKMVEDLTKSNPDLPKELTIEEICIQDPASYVKDALLKVGIDEKKLNKVAFVSPAAIAMDALYRVAPLSIMEWINGILNNQYSFVYRIPGIFDNLHVSTLEKLTKQLGKRNG